MSFYLHRVMTNFNFNQRFIRITRQTSAAVASLFVVHTLCTIMYIAPCHINVLI